MFPFLTPALWFRKDVGVAEFTFPSGLTRVERDNVRLTLLPYCSNEFAPQRFLTGLAPSFATWSSFMGIVDTLKIHVGKILRRRALGPRPHRTNGGVMRRAKWRDAPCSLADTVPSTDFPVSSQQQAPLPTDRTGATAKAAHDNPSTLFISFCFVCLCTCACGRRCTPMTSRKRFYGFARDTATHAFLFRRRCASSSTFSRKAIQSRARRTVSRDF